MNNSKRRLLRTLLLAAVFCFAFGGTLAEEACIHMEMHFTVSNGSSTLTQTCPDCGHSSFIALNPQVAIEGEEYTFPIATGGDPWDGPDAPADMPIQYYTKILSPFEQATPLAKPTAPGTYYASTEFARIRIFGQLTILSKDHVHSFGYSASGNVITARCGSCGMSAALTLSMSSATAGEAKPATLTADSRWPAALPEIAYYNASGDPLPALPQEAGEYYAAVAVEGQIAIHAFALTDAPIVPALLPAERILSNKPFGMAFASETLRDGMHSVVISREKTDWSAMVAQLFDTQRQKMMWQTPHIIPYPGATGYTFRSVNSLREDDVAPVVEELLARTQSNNIHGNATLSISVIGSYTPENNLFVPSGGHMGASVLGWYKDGKLIAVELLENGFSYDDETPFTIEADMIPATSILPAINLSNTDALEYAASNGAIAYRADSSSALGAAMLETGVQLPQEIRQSAASCEIRTDLMTDPVTVPVETIGGKPGIRISTALPAQNSAQGYSFTLTFFDEAEQYVKAYNLTITLRVGEPIPFPQYHSDWSAIPASRIQLQTTNTTGETIPSGLDLSYDAKTGVVNYDIDSRALPRDQALDTVLGAVHILPPEGAKAYRMYPPYEDGLSIRPDMYSMRNDDSLHAEERIAASPLTAMNNFFGRNIEYNFLHGQEITLIDGHPYTFYQLGLPDMGELGAGFRLIYWYADENDTEPMLKEYLLVTHDPACAPSFTALLSDESDLSGESAAYPHIVISRTDEDGSQYLFYSDVVPQTSDNEIHYELRITDADGNAVASEVVSKFAPLTVYIPVPDGVDLSDPALAFTVSHLSKDSTKVTETFSYAAKNLSLTEYGLCFHVSDLSPFVLSWDTAANADISTLPQTGDNSPAIAMLLVILMMSAGMLAILLPRKRA